MRKQMVELKNYVPTHLRQNAITEPITDPNEQFHELTRRQKQTTTINKQTKNDSAS